MVRGSTSHVLVACLLWGVLELLGETPPYAHGPGIPPGQQAQATAFDPCSPAVPSDPQLLDTCPTECVAQPGTAAWKRHTEDPILCSE